MTLVSVFKSATFLTGQAFTAAVHSMVHARTAQAFTGFGAAFEDAGDRLAEREAAEEVDDPPVCSTCGGDKVGGATHLISCPVGGLISPISNSIKINIEDGYPVSSIFRSSGQTHEYGPRPRISTPPPRRSDSDRLDRISAQLEDIRNLLQHGGRGDGKDVGERAESSSGAEVSYSPTSPPRERPSGSGPRCTSVSPTTGKLQCRKREGHLGVHTSLVNKFGNACQWHDSATSLTSAVSANPELSGAAEDPTLGNHPDAVHERLSDQCRRCGSLNGTHVIGCPNAFLDK